MIVLPVRDFEGYSVQRSFSKINRTYYRPATDSENFAPMSVTILKINSNDLIVINVNSLYRHHCYNGGAGSITNQM